MEQRFDFGEAVRLTRNVRNDGTFPGLEIGNLLIRRGSVGYVMNVGTFLQDQVIYTVNFLDHGRVVGCREEELQAADATWVESLFETREKVVTRYTLAVKGEVLAAAGTEGEVFKVLRDMSDGVQYHVRFPGHTLQVPESCLESPTFLPNPDGTPSHSTKPASGQVAGYPPQAGPRYPAGVEGANVVPKPIDGGADV
jgi:nitrogen fixation protein NifZ